jgi:hypothetical protein
VSGEILLQDLQALNNKDDRTLYLDLHDERPRIVNKQQQIQHRLPPGALTSATLSVHQVPLMLGQTLEQRLMGGL